VELTGLIGARSYYSHDFTVTELRRSGSMTKEQRVRRATYERRLGRPAPRALFGDVVDLLEANLPAEGRVELRTDDDKTYPRALKRALRRVQNPAIEHLRTNSKEPRTPKNPLFAINAHHGFLRHSGSNHKRETIAFSKRIQAVIYRHAVFQVWRNLVKPASLRDPRQTPAQRLGVTDRRWTIAELLSVRRLPTQSRLRKRVEDYYWGRRRSRWVRGERRHELVFAG
jgi:hypothetical protein